MPARPSDTEPSGRVACFRTPAAKSEYGRPSRSAIVREMLPICASSSSSRTSGRPATRATSSTVRSSWVGTEPSGDEAEVCGERLAEGVLEVFDGVADDGDRRRLETEADGLGREEGPVAVLALSADELRPRRDDRRARAAQEVARTILCEVTTNVVPLGSSTRFPFSRTSDVLRLRERKLEALPLERLALTLLERPAVEELAGGRSLPHLHPRVPVARANGEPRSALRTQVEAVVGDPD